MALPRDACRLLRRYLEEVVESERTADGVVDPDQSGLLGGQSAGSMPQPVPSRS